MNAIDNKKLMDYLEGKLSSGEREEVERWIEQNPFEAEALEGLRQYGNQKNLTDTIGQLNRQLRKYLKEKKDRRRKKLLISNNLVYVAIFLILALAVIVFLLIATR